MINQNKSNPELKDENKEMENEGGLKEREIELIRKNEFSFMDEEQ